MGRDLHGVHKGVNTRTDRHRDSHGSKTHRRNRVDERLPGRTVFKGEQRQQDSPILWKRPCAAIPSQKKPAAAMQVCKKPAMKVCKNPARDPQANGRWLWLGISIGKGRTRYTPANGKKRIAFAWLPAKANAPYGKPRGACSMKTVVKKHVKKGSFGIFDG